MLYLRRRAGFCRESLPRTNLPQLENRLRIEGYRIRSLRCDAHAVAAPKTVRFLSLRARTASRKVLPVVITSSMMMIAEVGRKGFTTSNAPNRFALRLVSDKPD